MWNSIFSRRKGPSGFSHSSTAEEVTEGIDGSGLIAIVTGASSGIGVETTRVLALRGVHVIMGVRNLSAGNDVKEEITKQNPNALVDIIKVDLSSMASVRKFVDEFSSQNLPLHILINNAGVVESKFTLSEDGIELSFATNHIGHFLLTDLLMENMKITAQKSGIEGRIINVSSDGYVLTYSEGIRFDMINEKTGYGGFSAYGQSKLANIFHAKELSSRLKEQGLNITANALHPGFTATNILRDWRFLNGILAVLGKFVSKSVQQGASTTCYVALHPQVRGVSGEYFEDCNLVELKPPATDQVLAKKLWDFSMDMIKGFDSSVEKSELSTAEIH